MAVAKILVVEDEGLTAMEIQRKLRNWGYDVPSFAFSCKEAIKKAKDIKPDLILMDIMLKGKGDGVDAAQEIKSIKDIPIIYITAYDDEKTRKRAEITHPTAYLIKPFEEKDLQNKIETALSEHETGKKLLDIGQRLDNKLKDFGVIIIDLNGNIVYANDYASNLTGFKSDEASDKILSEVFPIEGINEEKDVKTCLNEVIKGNTGVIDRSILKVKDGTEVHVEYNINPIMDEKDGFLGADLVFEDITQQVKDENSLMEREKKFRGIYYQSMLATEIFDEKGDLLDANPECLHLFGATNINQLKKFNLFNDFKLNSKEVETLKNGSEVRYECEFNSEELIELGFEKVNNEASIFLGLFITPLNEDGLIGGYLVQLQDITEHRKLEESLKDNEERYLKLLNTLDQALIVFNSDMKCMYCNNKTNEFLNLETDDVIGKSFQELMESFWDEELETMCLETLESGEPSTAIKILQKNKTPTYVEIKAFKSFEGLIILLNDVNDFKLRENELKRNETLYRSVVNDQSEIICRFNQDFQLTFANEAYYRCFGLNDKFNSVFSLSNDEDMDKMNDQFKSFDEENHIKIFEGPIKMPDGDITWWQWVTQANFDEKGNILEYQSVGHDVTQHHHAMEEIQNNMEDLRSSIKKKDKELEDLKISYELKIDEKNQEISSINKLNEDVGKKLEEKSRKLTETIKSQESELEILKNRETSLKEKMEIFKSDIQTKTIEAEKSLKDLEAEINIREETEETLQKTSADLKEQVVTTEMAFSEIDNLKKEIEEKEAKITQLKTDFETQVSNLEERELKITESLNKRENTLKNVYDGVRMNMQMISTLNRLHSEYVTDQMVEKLQDGRSYLRSFGMVHEKLYQSEDMETVNLKEYLYSILDDISRSHGAKNVDINVKTNDISLDMETAVMSGLIISELVINSLKHAFHGENTGKIMVEVFYEDENLVIKVSDNGVGIPSHVSVETADSFGLQLVRTFVEQSEGSIELKEGSGAEFIIKIPKHNK